MNTAQVIASFLARAGVARVFGYPGDPNVELIEALRAAGLEFVLTTREGTAGLAAEAAGMLGPAPGVCVSTLGPGSTNLVNAVANATLDRAPLLALSGQIDGRRRPTFTHQVVDHGRLFAPVAKWAGELRGDNAATVLRKAWRVALAERPGAVHCSTPGDVIGAEASDDDPRPPPGRPARQALTFHAAPGAADPAARIDAARRPLILYGLGAQRCAAGPAIARLAERLGCPLVSSAMAKGTVPEDHPLFAGVLDMACGGLIRALLGQADLIVAAGFDVVELLRPWTLATEVVHVDTVPDTDQVYAAEIEVVGPVDAALAMLAGQVAERQSWPRGAIAAHRDRLRARYLEGRVAGRLNPSEVVDALRAALPRDALATCDVGSHKLLVGQGWTTLEPRSLLMSNGLSSMGYALPAAIAAGLAEPARERVCLLGDGGLAMVQGELRVAAELGLAMRVVVFCDDSLNRIELKQRARQYPAVGTRFAASDVAALAEAMGCAGVRVARPGELERVLCEPPPADRPLVIAARIDPGQYATQF